MNLKTKQGFTLIELLVVVAIIGILASLVIASVNQARSRGNDAAIKGTMSSLRAQAELYYDQNGSFDNGTDPNGVCGSALFSRLVADINEKSNNAYDCSAVSGAWAAQVQLTTEDSDGDPQFFCVDSTGYAGDGGKTAEECNG